MEKTLSYEDYKKALKEKRINELFQQSNQNIENIYKISIVYPKKLDENDQFFFFATNFAERFFQEKLKKIYNLSFKDIATKNFDIEDKIIKYNNKDLISIKISETENRVKKEYLIYK